MSPPHAVVHPGVATPGKAEGKIPVEAQAPHHSVLASPLHFTPWVTAASAFEPLFQRTKQVYLRVASYPDACGKELYVSHRAMRQRWR